MLEGANIDQAVLMLYLKSELPTLWSKISIDLNGKPYRYIGDNMPPISVVVIGWMMSLLITTNRIYAECMGCLIFWRSAYSISNCSYSY